MKALKKSLYISAILPAMLLCSCARETSEPQKTGSTVSFHVEAEVPQAGDDAILPSSKIALSGQTAVWEGNETMAMLVGNGDSTTPEEGVQPILSTTNVGVFTGQAQMGDFYVDDVHGAVVPGEIGAWYEGSGNNLVLPVLTEQTLDVQGVFSGANVPFYSLVEPGNFLNNSGVYTFNGMVMKPGCAVIRFNIYGRPEGMADGELLRGIELHTADGKAISGQVLVDANSGTISIEEGADVVSQTLGTGYSIIGKTSSNGAKFFVSVLPWGEIGQSVTINKIVLLTNNASYQASFNESLSLYAGQMKQVRIDASNFGGRDVRFEFSTDGGDTWIPEIPATFRSLAVRGKLVMDNLVDIKKAIDAQSLPVPLDLSRVEYESNVFPQIFNGTETNPYRMIESIEFPANVNELPDRCFEWCQGLKTVKVGTQFTTMGVYVFSNCIPSEVYYEAQDTRTTTNNDVPYNARMFQSSGGADVPMTATFGPTMEFFPARFFQSNNNIRKIIVEGSGVRMGYGWIGDARNLEVIEFKAGPPQASNSSMLSYSNDRMPGVNVLPSDRKVIIPFGKTTEFMASVIIQKLVDPAGAAYNLVEAEREPYKVSCEISADGVEWGQLIPETFTKLYLRGALKLSDLNAIREAADLVPSYELDLGATTYASETFPAVFAGSEENDYTKLTAITLPSNVTAIADGAFARCSALASINLDNVTVIGASAFDRAGLASVTLPNTVTAIGNDAFRHLANLAEVNYNVPSATGTYIFGGENGADDTVYSVDQVVTIGKDVTTLPDHFLRGNHVVTKVIFEGSPAGGSSAFVYCQRLGTFEFKVTTPPATPRNAVTTYTGDKASGAKVLLVPEGAEAAFKAADPATNAWGRCVAELGFSIPVDSNVKYSTNGTDWTDAMPASFTKLYLKGGLNVTDLDPIKTAIAGASSAVDLDLTGVTFGSTEFPNTFAGTSDAHFTKLRSIKFPENVTTIAASAFTYCDLVEVTIPKTVTEIGNDAFRYISTLKNVYYDSPAATGTYIFAFATSLDSTDYGNSMTITIGPDVVTLPQHFMRGNPVVSTVEFEGTPDGGNYAFRDCGRISVFRLKNGLPNLVWGAIQNGTGSLASSRQIRVPSASVDAINAAIAAIEGNTNGFKRAVSALNAESTYTVVGE